MQPTEDYGDISKYHKLNGIEVSTATPSSQFIENVKYNVAKGYKKLSDLEEFAKIKGANNPIGLIGGGPSVKAEIDKIKKFKADGFPIIACGSSHDYLISQGIIPDYCTLCDPDLITGEYIKRHNEEIKYLVSLSCDPAIFEMLKDRKVFVWNCKSDEAAEHLTQELIGHVDILGGCTVGLRSISIAMCLGYNNLHLWGFDSCLGSGDAHHAYEFATDKEEVGVVYPVRFGDHKSDTPDETGKYYMCCGYHLAQAVHFQQFLVAFGAAFTPTFHGEGMLTDYMAYLKTKAQNQRQAA